MHVEVDQEIWCFSNNNTAIHIWFRLHKENILFLRPACFTICPPPHPHYHVIIMW